LALESADVVVLSPQLGSLTRLFRIAKLTRARLWQNIGLALTIKAVVLLITAAGYGTMWLAVAADVGASLLVIFNGMRLLTAPLEHEK
jgi:Cd2+/Zn2+-exporting ATPase